ncbi:hypothetical protein BCR43DRAFT_159700 [Syncephalastrum racemosum]|uniref:Uncharacterized protein n=1 Tax=Syncephalastrum racemosum TaxID=13706 RepID=A0A1X2HNF1_SYNRA|nr:hypothetical protein BCR43DRAFT_159700 [Syncephalastrum racemosum]
MFAALGTILTLFAAVYAQSTTTSGSSNSSTAATGQCLTYPGGVCSGYVNYTVYMPEGVSFQQVEQQLSVLTNLSALLSDIDYACVESYYRFACPFYYSRCVSESANESTQDPDSL